MKRVIYCDMDGVLADFNAEPNAVERFRKEKGFFYGLKPIDRNVEGLAELCKNNQVYILSASPHNRADREKKRWLKKYAPFIKKSNIILCRNGERKVDFMVNNKRGILLDDYGVNIREWQLKKGNVALKISNDRTIDKIVNIVNILSGASKN